MIYKYEHKYYGRYNSKFRITLQCQIHMYKIFYLTFLTHNLRKILDN